MGTLYFILKNSIITVVIVSLLQIQIAGKTFEDRLMGFIQHTVAPKFLGGKKTSINKEAIKVRPEDLQKIRQKIYGSKMFDGVKKSAKDLFLKEMTDVIKESNEKKIKELEALEKQN